MEKSLGSLAQPTDLNANGGFIAVRTALDPEQMVNSFRSTVASIDPQLPLSPVQSMLQAVSDTEAPRRFNTAVISAFAVAAVLLAARHLQRDCIFGRAPRTGNGDPHSAWIAAVRCSKTGVRVSCETGSRRLCDWIARRRRGIAPVAFFVVQCESV